MFDKLRYALALFDSTELLILLVGLLVYHIVILLGITRSVRSSFVAKLRALQAERDKYKKNWEHRDESWKDREEELRRILNGERERELSQVKAEYDSYVGLLEHKLARTKTREKSLS